MSLFKRISSALLAILILLSVFAVSVFANSNYNTDDLAFVKKLASMSRNLSADYNTENESNLLEVAELIGEWNVFSSEKRLVSIDLNSLGINDFEGVIDASELQYVSKIDISDNAGITGLKLPKSSNLKEIVIKGTSIKSIDISGKTSLVKLDAAGVNFTELDLTGCDKIKEIAIGSAEKFSDARGVTVDFRSPEFAYMVGMRYNTENHRITVTYKHPHGEIFFDKASLPNGADFVTQSLLDEGEPYSETTVWFTLSENVSFKPVFVSNSVNILKLTVNGEEIKPNGAGVFVAEVPTDVNEIDVSVITEGRATVEGVGKLTLKEGVNFFTIKVTSADGNEIKEYTLKITRYNRPDENEDKGIVGIIIVIIIVILVLGGAGFIYYRKNKAKYHR